MQIFRIQIFKVERNSHKNSPRMLSATVCYNIHFKFNSAISCMSFDCPRTQHEIGKAFYHVNVSSETRNDKAILSWRNDTSFSIAYVSKILDGLSLGQNHFNSHSFDLLRSEYFIGRRQFKYMKT